MAQYIGKCDCCLAAPRRNYRARGVARRRPAAGGGGLISRPRSWLKRGTRAANLRAVLHDQVERHRSGNGDCPANCFGPRRHDRRRRRTPRGHDRSHFAARYLMSQRLRIAVADDEADMRDFFERMLPLCGHEVVSLAETGKELVEHCQTLHPDLVITDIKMPDMDGIDASTQICRDRPTPVILVSAYHDPQLVHRAEADHVMAYLVKPIGQADLGPAIAVAISRFQELQALRKETGDLKQALADRKV